ncbi:DUF443 family protein [Lactococcus allomyrinae]|uniref:DUF443 family protein n=1 Tax=Lactococcus allomyrinae TaxID=2419773 RepID=A0A387BGC6_9LACT|nr:DUF443 family protein [Lactococcus allomyrinae]AYG00459.1 DUF443 family protein [Lactococcus allomyrinae]
MEGKLISIYKNDRYKIVEAGEKYYLLDTDDRKSTILLWFLGLFGYHKVLNISKLNADDLIVGRVEQKNINNRSFLYGLLLSILGTVLTYILPINYISIIILLLYNFIGVLGIKFFLAYEEKKSMFNRVNLDKENFSYIKLRFLIPNLQKTKRFFAWLFLQVMFIVVVVVFVFYFTNPLVLFLLVIVTLMFILLFSRAAFAEGNYLIKEK